MMNGFFRLQKGINRLYIFVYYRHICYIRVRLEYNNIILGLVKLENKPDGVKKEEKKIAFGPTALFFSFV